jgi:hypothetical protein
MLSRTSYRSMNCDGAIELPTARTLTFAIPGFIAWVG